MQPTLPATAFVVFGAIGAFGQTPPRTDAFEVASIRSSQTGGGEGSRREDIQFTPDSVTMRNVTLRSAIQWGYHVMEYQVSGPEWLGTQRFDIVAKSGAPVSEKQLRTMVQGLLADRFQVALHRVPKEFSAFALLVARNGPKFQESQSEGKFNMVPDQKRMIVTIERAPISQLVEMLERVFRAPIVDQTELTGRYDVTIDLNKYLADFQPSAGGAPPDPLSIITRGLQDELGLKLESKKVTLDQLIIDHAEKVPSEN